MRKLGYLLFIAVAAAFIAWTFQGKPEGPVSLREEGLLPLDLEYVRGPEISENQPALLDFWATWCAPCRESIPKMNRIYEKYKRKGLQIVGITAEDSQTVSAFLENMPMDYTVALDRNLKYFSSLRIDAIPHLVLLNSAGEILWRGHPMALPESLLEDVTKGLVPGLAVAGKIEETQPAEGL